MRACVYMCARVCVCVRVYVRVLFIYLCQTHVQAESLFGAAASRHCLAGQLTEPILRVAFCEGHQFEFQ